MAFQSTQLAIALSYSTCHSPQPSPMAMTSFIQTPLPNTSCKSHRETTSCPLRSPRKFCNATAAPHRTAPEPSDRFSTKSPPRKTDTIIVPGKFDAFHLGHRELARVAATIGSPMLLSFSGMAEALKWPPRAPVVAAVDRDRILRAWSGTIGAHIAYRVLPFAQIRDQSPEQFLDMVIERFGARGIVCGHNWRFGHRAAGDVALLKELAPALKLEVRIVDAVDMGDNGGVVSSTRVRSALANGEVVDAKRMLGRSHRLVGYVGSMGRQFVNCNRFVNQVPGDGVYRCVVRVIGRSEPFRAQVKVKRPGEVDPMVPVGLLDDPDEVTVQIEDAEVIYCEDCEVYLDFVERIG